MEGFKKLEVKQHLNQLRRNGVPVFILLMLINFGAYKLIEPSVCYEFGMLVSCIALMYFIFDYRGY